jgi:integrase/recombinase XerC
MAQQAERRRELAGSARLVMVQGATLLRPEQAVFEAMLAGWRSQQRSRLLAELTVTWRERIVRRFTAFTGELPWRWAPGDVEEWTSELLSGDGHAHSTIRSYQRALASFLDYLTDGRYGWADECEARFGTHPVQVCHEWNTAVHAADYEGRPERRPFTRAELQAFFDFADERVAVVRARGRKGWLAAFRDATLFKVTYAWGLRRREAAMLDVADFSTNPAAPELGRFGSLAVRYGKAVKSGPPRRRQVATVMPWAAEAVGEYLAEVRPRYGPGDPALWLTERGGRISVRQVDERFAGYRDAAGLPGFLTPHCLRHSYVSHLIEDGADPVFVQHQVGHSWASTTAGYTSVGADHANRMLRAALDRAFTGVAGEAGR